MSATEVCLINNTASGTVLNLFFHVYGGRGRGEGRGGGNKDGVCNYFYAKNMTLHFYLVCVCVFDSVITVSY